MGFHLEPSGAIDSAVRSKAAIVLAGEYGNNEPESFIAHHFSWVPDLSIGYAVLAPLGLLGMAVSRRAAARLFPLWGFFAPT